MKTLKEAPKIMRKMSRSTSTMLEFSENRHLPFRSNEEPESAAAKSRRTYRSYKTTELLRAFSVLKLSSYRNLVNNAESIISTSKSIFGKTLTSFAIKKTMYDHFCGGETEEEVRIKTFDMIAKGVIPILDYSVEADTNSNISLKEKAESTLKAKLDQFDLINSCVTNGEGISPIKPSSLCNPIMLQDLTTYLRENRVDFSAISSNFEDNSEDAFVKSVCETIKNQDLHQDMAIFARNLYQLGTKASELNQKILIDAEYYAFQAGIDYFGLKAMQMFNQKEIVFFNTFQCYLKQTTSHLDSFITNSRDENYYLGAKLVRGAYMNHERSVNDISPVHETIQDTHDSYNSNSAKLIQLIKETKGKVGVVFATHNLESAKTNYKMVVELSKDEKSAVKFAQLNGMAVDVTQYLIEKGEKPLNLLPYGPIDDVLPYLIRRAQENNCFLTQTEKQRKEMLQELRQRYFTFA